MTEEPRRTPSGNTIERLTFDALTVTALPIGSFTASYDLLDGMSSDDAIAFLRDLNLPTDAEVHAHAFAIESPDHITLIDAGMGAGSALDGLATSLARAGIAADRVDAVVITHLHPDHALGLLDGDLATAAVFVPAAEVDFARNSQAMAMAGPYTARDYARAAEVLDVIGPRLVEIPPTPAFGSLPAGLVPEPLPGHSPGHTGYRLSTGRADVLFVGDLLHFPELQGRRPEVSVVPDIDARTAAETRRTVLADAAATGTILAGAHLGTRGFRRVLADGNATQLQ